MTLTWSFSLITMVVAMQTMWRRTGKSTASILQRISQRNKSGGTKVTYTNPDSWSVKMVAGVITTEICFMWSWSTNI